MTQQRLGVYNNDWFDRGRPLWVEALWILASVYFSSSLPGSTPRRWLLGLFGARIGRGVVVKPRVRIKFPWKLNVGDDVWIGEAAWIDNLAEVSIGNDVCVSQGVYICTGSHDWQSESFDLLVKPVEIEQGAWLGSYSRIAPGVVVGNHAVIGMGAVLTVDADPSMVYLGNPAVPTRTRYPDAGQTTSS